MSFRKFTPLLLCLAAPLSAEPTKTARYLMNDTPSMLEWGIFKLDRALSAVSFPELNTDGRSMSMTEYDWDSNELDIQITAYPSHDKIQEIGGKEACRIALASIKKRLGFASIDLVPNPLSVSNFFRHEGFHSVDSPDSFTKDVEEMTRVTVSIYSSKTNKPIFDRQSVCSSKFLDPKVYFVDIK